MIPLPQILAELIAAVGAALLGASLLALVRPRAGAEGRPERPQASGRVIVNAFIGLVVMVWGLATFLTQRG